MSTVLKNEPVSAPVLPLGESLGSGSIYCLAYKDHKVDHEFFLANSQQEAEALGRKYCEVFKKRYIWVSPWLRDLKKAIDSQLEKA